MLLFLLMVDKDNDWLAHAQKRNPGTFLRYEQRKRHTTGRKASRLQPVNSLTSLTSDQSVRPNVKSKLQGTVSLRQRVLKKNPLLNLMSCLETQISVAILQRTIFPWDTGDIVWLRFVVLVVFRYSRWLLRIKIYFKQQLRQVNGNNYFDNICYILRTLRLTSRTV